MPDKRKKKGGGKTSKRRNQKKLPSKKEFNFFQKLLVHVTNTDNNFERKLKWRSVFVFASVIIFLSLLYGASSVGINGDENIQVPYSVKSIDFYKSLGADTTVLSVGNKEVIRHYGGGFEIPAGLINRVLGYHENDRRHHHIRHFLCSILGFLVMIGVGLIAKILSNWRGATYALVLLWLSPRFFGHALINPKDVPFAAGYIMSILFMILVFKHLPKINLKYLAGLSISLGYCLAIRSGGLLVFIYFGVFFLFYNLARTYIKNYSISFGAFIRGSFIPLILGYIVGMLLWPYGILDPIKHPIESLSTFSNFSTGIKVLFDGSMLWSTDLPEIYPLQWIFITVPIAYIIGVLLSTIFIVKMVKMTPKYFMYCNIFMFSFPLFYIFYKDSALYDGWRHLIFIYVASIPVVALGWESLSLYIEKKNWSPYLIPLIFVGLMLEPALNIAKNIEYSYTYFNPIKGGISNAFGEYELDYWGISTRQAIEKLEELDILNSNMTQKITIGTNFPYGLTNWLAPEYRDSVQIVYTRYRERYNRNWDYAVYISRFMDGAHMKAIEWPGKDRVLDVITNNDTPIAAIYKRGDNHYFQAMQKIKENNISEAIELLSTEIKHNPQNELAYYQLANLYSQLNNAEMAEVNYKKVLDLSPQDVSTHINYSLFKLRLGKTTEAKNILAGLLSFDKNNYTGYYYMAYIDLQSNNLNNAKENISKCIKLNPGFKQGYKLASDIYLKLGDTRTSEYYNRIFAQFK